MLRFPVFLFIAACVAVSAGEPAVRLAPTHANLSYGPHERNKLDLWIATSTAPTPLIVFIHGGGYRNGDKNRANPGMIKRCLDVGISFMSINYRFREHAPIQQIVRDGARAIQFVRARSRQYNLNPSRIAAYGSSAGAGITQWLAFHDDIADPLSPDPILHQSSRIVAAGAINCQATLNRDRWPEFIGPRNPQWWLPDEKDYKFYGIASDAAADSPQVQAALREMDTLRLVTADDPPVFFHTFNHADGPPQNRNHYVHHPNHPRAVKAACDAAGVPNEISFELAEPRREGDFHAPLFVFLRRYL